ncbi:MAG: TIM-barrel domain-containing protein [Omnitrophica WOR_2 bacterium]
MNTTRWQFSSTECAPRWCGFRKCPFNPMAASVFKRLENGLEWRLGRETLRVEAWGRDSLRVRATKGEKILDLPGALLEPQPIDAKIETGEAGASIENGKLRLEISAAGRLRFTNAVTGSLLLEEQPNEIIHPPARFFRPLQSDLNQIEVKFLAQAGERFYGLGQHPHGLLDQKGCVIDLVQLNTQVSIPFLLSSRMYGFLWNNPAVGRVELGNNLTRWVAQAARQVDYWVTAGESYAEIMEHYADATGHAPLLPEYAAGFWQCKLRYRTQEEVLTVAREYRQRGLPLSIIVIDGLHWTYMGDWMFNPAEWPDPAGMVREIEEMGIKVMVSIWPTVNTYSRNFDEMERNGWLVQNERGAAVHLPFMDTYPRGRVYLHYYDAMHPEARRFVWEQISQNYYRNGIKLFWLDSCEPELYTVDHDNLRFYLGNGMEVGNLYPLLHAQGFYDGLRSEGESEILTLARSAWAGSQRYGAAVWSGDIPSTFDALQLQVRAGLNMALSGIPWWTTDIGGFHSGDIRTAYFQELIVRWFQFGVFCPLFRLHGVRNPPMEAVGGPNEVWSFGDRAYAIIKELLFLRESMRPYIMEHMRLASEKGTPLMRPLFFDFSQDETAYRVDDQFMFGPDVLVAPVLFQGSTSRRVYLPEGTGWMDPRTDVSYPGGQWLEVDAPLDAIPYYFRAGAPRPF